MRGCWRGNSRNSSTVRCPGYCRDFVGLQFANTVGDGHVSDLADEVGCQRIDDGM